MLEIAKYPAYLSPSSMGMFYKQPNKFYLTRMAPNPFPPEPQGLPAAVGSALDARIKWHYAKMLGKEAEVRELAIRDSYNPEAAVMCRGLNFYETLCKINIEPQWYDEAVSAGTMLYQVAMKTPAVRRAVEAIEIHKNFTLFGVVNVPIFMKLDAALAWEGKLIPLDWKVCGYGSQASPKPGYKEIYDGMAAVDRHKNYRPDISWEEIDLSWAEQLCTYGWGLGLSGAFPAVIDSLVIRKTGVRVVHYEGWITESFQTSVRERYGKAWAALRDGSYIASLPSERGMVELLMKDERWY